VAEGYLAELGCTSAWVASAEGAIARFQTERFDMIFMDLNMSDMDGFAATARIREREAAGAHMPIVALTAHEANSYRARVLAAGMDDILSKPYSLEDCRAMLARWIAQRPLAETEADPAALASVDAGAVRTLGQLGTGGPAMLYGRLAALFESSSHPVMAQLDAALRAGELGQAADKCHRLKSSAANVGALAFAAGLRELEQCCRKGDAEHAARIHQRLLAAYPLLLATLRTRRMAERA